MNWFYSLVFLNHSQKIQLHILNNNSVAGSGSGGKKCSLTVAAVDIAMDTTSPTSERNGRGKTDMLTKKSPMHKLARLAKLAGTTIGKDAINSKGFYKCCNTNTDSFRCILESGWNFLKIAIRNYSKITDNIIITGDTRSGGHSSGLHFFNRSSIQSRDDNNAPISSSTNNVEGKGIFQAK